jgi:hypothetical protein
MPVADKLLLDRLLGESQLSAHSDALDVKASVFLVAVTFLATQSAYLLSTHADGFIHWEQTLAAGIEIAAGFLLAWSLRIRAYSNECAEDYPKWRDSLVTEEDDSHVEDQMISEIVEGLVSRCTSAYDMNNRKEKILRRAYWVMFLGLGLNCLALIALSDFRVCILR